MIKVILLQDIEGLGKKYEIKRVKDGYLRNFLIPQKLVTIATKDSLAWLESVKEIESEKNEEGLKKIQEVASKLDGLEVMISVKVGEEGQLFESINTQKIVDKLKELGFEINKKNINLENPIKELGEFFVKIKLDHNLEPEIRVILIEES